MKFTKMHGCGNDYIYVDGSREIIPAEQKPEYGRFQGGDVRKRHKVRRQVCL